MHPGKLLILIGLLCCGIGLFWLLGHKLPLVGRLPGDIVIKKENFTVYFPLGTCLLISFIVTLLFWFFRR